MLTQLMRRDSRPQGRPPHTPPLATQRPRRTNRLGAPVAPWTRMFTTSEQHQGALVETAAESRT